MNAYKRLEERFARVTRLSDALGILGWDKETTMPLGAAEARGETIATLSVIAHETLTAPLTADLLAAADDIGLTALEQANLREMRRQYAHATAVPADLVAAASRAATACEVRWRQARADDDFAGLKDHLSEVLATQREIGRAKGEALGLGTYDALLDGYDPGTRQSSIDPIFARLQAELPGLIADAVDRQNRRKAPIPLRGPFPVEKQRQLGERLIQAIGFDLSHGRLDVSAHPFCGGASGDVRITTRFDTDDFMPALMGVLHETGHALYEQGRPSALWSQPVGQARGMSLHESQSLFIEMQICRGGSFQRFLSPLLEQTFGGQAGFEPDNLTAILQTVEPSLIRVDADEVTYPAHTILRYQLESALIEDRLTLPELPTAFNDGMKSLLGIDVPDDRTGCLQDVHWPAGLFGYFPTYSLGAMIAAQIAAKLRSEMPELDDDIEEGRFEKIVAWLRKNIHEQASRADTATIVHQATGEPLGPDRYLTHLRQRYAAQV